MEHTAKTVTVLPGFPGFQVSRYPTVIGFAIGLAATLTVVFVVWRSDVRNFDAERSARIDSGIRTISAQLHRYEDLAVAAQADAEGSREPIGVEEYRIIAARLLRGRDGIQALNYAPRVLSSDRGAFEAQARAQGLTNFRIMESGADGDVGTAGDRADYFPIYDVYPAAGNEVALGLDLAVSQVPSIDLARDSGEIIASAPFRLIGKADQWAFLLVAPVYQTLAASTVAERRAKIKGYAIATFRIGDMFQSMLQSVPYARGMDFYIFDGSRDHPGQLLYVHSYKLRNAATPPPSFERISASPARVDSLQLDRHEWTIVTVPLATWHSLRPELNIFVPLILGLFCTAIGTFYAISTRRHAAYLGKLTAKLGESEHRLKTIFNSVSEGIFVSDPHTGAFLDVNPSGCELFGYERHELVGRNIADLSSGVSGHALATALEQLKLAISGKPQFFEWQCKAKGGRIFWVEIALRCVPFGNTMVALATLRDITERRRIREHLIDVARYDGLTGLVNRTAFLASLQEAAARARRNAHFFAVLYLDLDHFKDINDTLGHPVGDLVLIAVADRLRANVRETDIIARFGGDEFAVLAAELREPTDAGVLAMKIGEAFREPFVIKGNVIRTAASIGIAIFDIDSPIVETLLAHADLAMYRAKLDGRSGYKFFTDSMDAEVRERVSLAKDLADAIASESLVLLYQPQVEMASGRIHGVEALVRWPHPTRGMLSPVQFIAAAEKSGLIVELGRWVLREACRQAKAWLDEGIAPILMGVNFSAFQLRSPLEAEKDIVATLAETRLPAHCLEIELTETALMEASREHNDVLQRIHDLGVKLAIDDFGTGYSSLDYLRRYPVDRIKIAQTFVADITSDNGDVAIVKATIGLARELKIGLIAEGVETREQSDLLMEWGCKDAQGFHFSEPLSGIDVKRLLRAGKIASIRRPDLLQVS